MKSSLIEQFITSMSRLKKLEAVFSAECEMQINELAVLYHITTLCNESPGVHLNVPMIQEQLLISKPAVSYILNSLEKKSYIIRKIDLSDRRKISISVTSEGRAAADQSIKKYYGIWTEILQRFGENNMKQLIKLLTDLNNLYRTLDDFPNH
ncbi:MAG: MarR family transcriptional regulator [Lachnospiraceae bacterium]|nr:MarR family transcriptional regulator [Lachnospiraceae bacterium]